VSEAINGWWDGAVEPFNPGAIGTYGFVVRAADQVLATEHGLSAVPFSEEATNNVAEYVGLVKLLDWLVRNGHTSASVRLFGDSKLVISQVVGKWKVNTERLQPLHRLARDYVLLFRDLTIDWVPREENKEADGLTHRAYVEYLDQNPDALKQLPLASPGHLETLRDHGIETYRYMGVREANRLLERRLRALEAAREEH
jgi:ribonuclease HI